jgi:hypothetical protein
MSNSAFTPTNNLAIPATTTQAGTVTTVDQTFAGKKTFDGGAAIRGDTSGASIASGFVGERKPFTSRAVVCTNAASWYGNSNALTTLTTGVWLVVVKGSWVGNNTANAITFGYATNGASNDTGLIEVEAAVNAQNASASSGPVYTSTYYYIATTDTPIYGKAVSEDQPALTVTIGGFAIRIA